MNRYCSHSQYNYYYYGLFIFIVVLSSLVLSYLIQRPVALLPVTVTTKSHHRDYCLHSYCDILTTSVRTGRRSSTGIRIHTDMSTRSTVMTSIDHDAVPPQGNHSTDGVMDDDDDNTTVRVSIELPMSSQIRMTDDPCVVLMKQLIQKHQQEYASNHPNDSTIYSLAQGIVYWEPPIACQTSIIEAFTTTNTPSTSKLHLYSPDEGLYELRQLLLNKIHNENQLTNHDVIVTSGANQAYMNCVMTLLSSSSSYAVIFAPYYFNHYMALQMTIGTDHILIGNLTSQSDKLPDIQWLREQFIIHNTETTIPHRRIDMVTITNPCNPTGIAYTKEQIQPFVDLCRQYRCYVVLDATYEYFVHDTGGDDAETQYRPDSTNSFSACFNNEEHLIHIFSLSKSYAMAGYRIGYLVLPRRNIGVDDNNAAVTPSTTLYDNVMKVQDTIAIAPSHIGQIAAIGALQYAGQGWVQSKVRTLRAGRTAIYDALKILQPNVIGGSGAMYYMAQLPSNQSDKSDDPDDVNTPANDVDIAERLIKQFGIAIIPGTFCGAPGWIRICYANLPPDECIIAAQRLEHGLQSVFRPISTPQNA